MISFAEAQALVLSRARSFGREKVSLEEADGRILAENLISDRDYPPFNRAMMDGYAFDFHDWDKGIREYKIIETIFPGQAPTTVPGSGHCYKIMTGAAVPEPANTIIRREDAEEFDGQVSLHGQQVVPFLNVARKGEDVLADTILTSGPLLCSPSVVSALATIGKSHPEVMKLPSVALITTGNEVVGPGQPVSELQIRNSNLFLLRSLLRQWQIQPDCQHIRDDRNLLEKGLQPVLGKDIIILNGAVSAGDADYVPEILTKLGVRKLFHGVSIRPGKPIWCGETPAGGIVFALPGNPLSCLTTFTVFIHPFLQKCLGLAAPATMSLPLSEPRTKKSQLTEFFPVSVESGYAYPIAFKSSGDVTAAIKANGLGVQPADVQTIENGNTVTIYPLSVSG